MQKLWRKRGTRIYWKGMNNNLKIPVLSFHFMQQLCYCMKVQSMNMASQPLQKVIIIKIAGQMAHNLYYYSNFSPNPHSAILHRILYAGYSYKRSWCCTPLLLIGQDIHPFKTEYERKYLQYLPASIGTSLTLKSTLYLQQDL